MTVIGRSTVLRKPAVFGLGLMALLLASGGASDRGAQVGASASGAPAASGAPHRQATETQPDDAERIAEAYGRLPLSFEANVGQTDQRVEFLARGNGYTLFLSKGAEAVLALRAARAEEPSFDLASTHLSPAERAGTRLSSPPAIDEERVTATALKLRLIGANADRSGQGRSQLLGKVNYLVGADRSAWRSGIATYAKVQYDDVYPGIDVVFYGNQRQLEYDFIVRPGADPNDIVLELDGADHLVINDAGELVAILGEREVVQRRPTIYQEIDGVRREVSGRYVLVAASRAAFEVDAYDRQHPLVIDPVLVYSTYLGGANSPLTFARNTAQGLALDGQGGVYITGKTDAFDFPTTAGAPDATWNGGTTERWGQLVGASDAFVAKMDLRGAGLVYSTYLGGSDNDSGNSIAVDAAGSAYVTGDTSSTDFPTTIGALMTRPAGASDVFVTKLDPTGTSFMYSTYVGGHLRDFGNAIAVGPDGNAYVTGSTGSSDFPVTAGVFQPTSRGGDAFVTRLNAEGTALAYSTYLGGSGGEQSNAIAVDDAGHAYVTGWTTSTDFPTAGSTVTVSRGGYDVFVTKLAPDGATLVYSGYLSGTSAYESGEGIAVDAAGSAYVTGGTYASDFPTTAGAFMTAAAAASNVFVAKLHASGLSLEYSTFVGGDRNDWAYAIAVDAAGSVYVTGCTKSANYPTTPGAFDTTAGFTAYDGSACESGGTQDAFVAKLSSSGSALVYSTYLGGTGGDVGYGVAVDALGVAYVAGSTLFADFPTTAGALDRSGTLHGEDAFVTTLDPSGASLAYSTYFGGRYGGGRAESSGADIAVDAAGHAYVIGTSNAIDFPTTAGASDTSFNGNIDAFVAKLNASGTDLVYATYLGGSGQDNGANIAVDAAGAAYLTGSTNSRDFPVSPGALDGSQNGESDVFVTKLDASGGAVEYSTYLGGSTIDSGQGIALDAGGSVYVTGYTSSGDFPTTAGAFDTTWNGASDAFLTKLDPLGVLWYSTYWGGSGDDSGSEVAVDPAGGAYVAGSTESADFPTTIGAFDTTFNAVQDAFVTKLSPDGSTLAYSTYVGGSTSDNGSAIAVDAGGSAYVTGSTFSYDFPVTAGAADRGYAGNWDAFVTKLDPSGGSLVYSTFFGDHGNEGSSGIAVDADGRAYFTGNALYVPFSSYPPVDQYAYAYVATLDPSGARIESFTFDTSGGYPSAPNSRATITDGVAVALDGDGFVYVTGWTNSPYFATTTGAFDSTLNGRVDAFIAKVTFQVPAANQAPTARITGPEVPLYSAGQVITYSGSGTDPEDGALSGSAFTWRVDFHHDTHVHPFIQPTTGSAGGSFTVPTRGETSANVWYRIYLTVRDSAGLTHTTQRDIVPRKVRITLTSNPSGLQLNLDGQPITTPMSFDGVVGLIRNLEALSPQTVNGGPWAFASWSDGGAVRHDISTPSSDTTYTATFVAGAPADTGPIGHWDMDAANVTESTVTDRSGHGHHGTISGATLAAGMIGDSLTFDGVNDRVDVPGAPALDTAAGFTVAFWYLADAQQGSIVAKPYGTGSLNSWQFEFVSSGTALSFTSSDGSTQQFDTVAAPGAGTWIHIAGTWDGATKRLFINGAPALTVARSIATGPLDVVIGGDYDSGTFVRPFRGRVDEVRMYDRALSYQQIQQLHQAAFPSDTEAPSVPTGLTATAVSPSRIDLSWQPATDNVDVTGYRIFRQGVAIGTASGTSYSDTGLSASTTYSYEVAAYDAAGNQSLKSTAVAATTTATPVLTSIVVTPASATVPRGGTQQFTGEGRDQFGNPMAATVRWWSVSGGGNIDAGGLFTATSLGGPFSVTANAGGASGGATVRVVQGLTDTAPIAHWDMNAASVTGSTLADRSGRGHHGTISGATLAAGIIGDSLAFDGVNDRVDIPGAPALDTATGFTVAFWYLADAKQGSIVAKPYGTGYFNSWQFEFVNSGTALSFTSSDGSSQHFDTVPAPAAGTWIHVAGTWDGATKRLFINGAPALTVARSIAMGPLDVVMGGDYNSGTFVLPFKGRIDEVRMYDRALSDQQIQQLHGTQAASAPTRFEETAATLAPGDAWYADSSAGVGVTLSGDRIVYANVTGASATVSFSGTGVSWLGVRCEVCGIARVVLDGVEVATVDTFASARSADVIFSRSGLAGGSHRLVIEVTGTQNAASGNAFVAVDAFDVTP